MVGDGDQVDVVGHQGLEVEEAVGVGAADGLAVVAALGDVVRRAGQDEAFFSGNASSLWPHADLCK